MSNKMTNIYNLYIGVSTGRDPRDVVIPFFKRISEPEYTKGFQEAVNDFIRRIQKRAIDKRIEMEKEEAEERKQSAPVGPGGLNPYEVLERLPEALRAAFEEQDTEALQAVIAGMSRKDAAYWMKQCVDSGLWVPSSASKQIFEEGDEGEEEEEEEGVEEDGTADAVQ